MHSPESGPRGSKPDPLAFFPGVCSGGYLFFSGGPTPTTPPANFYPGPSLGLRIGPAPACEAGLSAGMRRERVPLRIRKKERIWLIINAMNYFYLKFLL